MTPTLRTPLRAPHLAPVRELWRIVTVSVTIRHNSARWMLR